MTQAHKVALALLATGKAHFNADAVRTMYRNFETSMIPEYLAARDDRDAALRLITPQGVA